MSRIDYYGIEEEIKKIIENGEDLEEVTVHIEEELSLNRGPTVMVYLDRRDAPTNLQTASGGTRSRFHIDFSIWCYESHLELSEAIKKRDKLLGLVEVALLNEPTLNGEVAGAWIVGGEFDNAKSPAGAGFFSGGEIILRVDKTATT